MSLYAFHLGQIISTVLGQVDHDGQHGNAARTPIRDETSETDHTQKRRLRHSAIYQTIKALAILRCLYGSEMVVLGADLGKCEMPSTRIPQENDHAILISPVYTTLNFWYGTDKIGTRTTFLVLGLYLFS
jgi:hypothetical protein